MARPRQADAADSSPAAGGARSSAQGARLAQNQLRRMRRIVDAAVDLAEKGGFEAVRLRDVAEQSDVALGTLYKYFRSKEDILLFALNEEIERLEHDDGRATARRPGRPTSASASSSGAARARWRAGRSSRAR